MRFCNAILIFIAASFLSGCGRIWPTCTYAIGSQATSPDMKYDAAAFLINCDTGSIESDEVILIRRHSIKPADLSDLSWIYIGGIEADDAGPIIEWRGPSDLFVKFDKDYMQTPIRLKQSIPQIEQSLGVNFHQNEYMTDQQYSVQKMHRLQDETDDNRLNDEWLNKIVTSEFK